MKFTYQILLLFCFTWVIFADDSTEMSPTEDEKTEQSTEPEEEVDVSVQPIEKKNNKKNNKPKEREELTPKNQQQQIEFPNFPQFSPYPEFYYPSLKPDFLPPGSYYNPYNSYPSLSPRFGGQFPGIPGILLPEIPSKKDKPKKDKKNKKPKEDSSEKESESEEMEGSGMEEEDSDKDDDKEEKADSKPDKKPKISIIRVLQLPYLPVLRSPPSWGPPRVDTVPLDPISNNIGFDGFGPRISNPWFNGPFLGRSFAPQYIFRR